MAFACGGMRLRGPPPQLTPLRLSRVRAQAQAEDPGADRHPALETFEAARWALALELAHTVSSHLRG